MTKVIAEHAALRSIVGDWEHGRADPIRDASTRALSRAKVLAAEYARLLQELA